MHHRYPIDKTSIDFNLTSIDQTPKLGRTALIALVEWIANRSKRVGLDGLGCNSTGESLTLDKPIRPDSIEENKNGHNAGGISQ